MMRETIPDLTHWRTQQAPQAISYYQQTAAGFTPVTYAENATLVQNLALGLSALGMHKSDRAAIISNTRAAWSQADSAILNLGGVVVGIYPTSTPAQIGYILDHSETEVAFVENKAQFEKLSQLSLTHLKHIIVIDSTDLLPGTWLTMDELATKGKRLLADKPTLPDEMRAAIQPEDIAALIYTSGTTGPPKGVVMRHSNLVMIAETVADFLDLRPSDVGITYLPLAHSLQRVSTYIGMGRGLTGYYLDDIYKLVDTCKVVEPTILSAVPRIYEKIQASIMAELEKAPPRRQKLFHSALAVGADYGRRQRQGEAVPFMLKVKHAIYNRLVFRKIRAALFGSRMRFLSSGAAPISPQLLTFFEALGLTIYEGYGLTETTSPITVNRPGEVKFGTVGRPLPGSEVKIAEDGEILLKGPGVFTEYYKEPEATRAAFSEDGWFLTGDIGELDEDGYLRITDRKKNIIVTAGGKNVAPANVENRLINSPYISQALVHGDRRKYLVALLTLDPEAIFAWANEKGKGAMSYEALTRDEAVLTLVQAAVDQANQALARYEQIKYFRILPEEMSVENDMLTPSLKLKRRIVEEKYGTWLDNLYA